MANSDAWNAGWNIGSRAASKGKGTDLTRKASKPVKQITTSSGQTLTPSAPLKPVGSYKKGGKVKKTGYAKVHKGEVVLTASEAKSQGKKSTHKSRTRKRTTSKG